MICSALKIKSIANPLKNTGCLCLKTPRMIGLKQRNVKPGQIIMGLTIKRAWSYANSMPFLGTLLKVMQFFRLLFQLIVENRVRHLDQCLSPLADSLAVQVRDAILCHYIMDMITARDYAGTWF